MPPLQDIEQEMRRLILAAQDQNIHLRVLGGLAVRIHCPSVVFFNRQRSSADIDLITDRAGGKKLEEFLTANHYDPDKAFNLLNGARRQLYYDPANKRQIDVFIGEFEMCHRLPLANRLHLEPITAPLAELFLSKAQIIQLNLKDAIDLVLLLLDHPVGDRDEETINAVWIASLCAKDWGLYTTVGLTLDHVKQLLERQEISLTLDQKRLVLERIASVQAAMDAAPKGMAWKTRARVGTRLRWYLEVEEIQR